MEDNYNEYRSMSDKLYYSMPDKDSITEKLVDDCLNTLFVNSIPSITFEELKNKYREIQETQGKEVARRAQLWQAYYCPHTIQNQIIDHYMSIYNLEKKWEDHVDIVLRDLENGPTIDKWIERDGDQPGYRGYEHLDPLKDKIGEEAYNQVVDYINKIKNFYRFEFYIDNIRFSIWDPAPNTSKEKTIEWHRKHGEPDFDITDEEIENKYFKDDDYDDEYIETEEDSENISENNNG